jgi:hypothetical protein
MTTINVAQLQRMGQPVPKWRYEFIDQEGIPREVFFDAVSQSDALDLLYGLARNLTSDLSHETTRD